MLYFILGLIIGVILGTLLHASGEQDRKEKYKKEFQKQYEHEKRMQANDELLKNIQSRIDKQAIKDEINSNRDNISFFTEGSISQSDIADFAERKIDSKYYRPKKDCDSTHELYRKKAVITGKFNHFPDRNELAKLLYDVGVDLDTTITDKTNFVVVGNDPGWRKLELIETYGIITYNEEEIKKIFHL